MRKRTGRTHRGPTEGGSPQIGWGSPRVPSPRENRMLPSAVRPVRKRSRNPWAAIRLPPTFPRRSTSNRGHPARSASAVSMALFHSGVASQPRTCRQPVPDGRICHETGSSHGWDGQGSVHVVRVPSARRARNRRSVPTCPDIRRYPVTSGLVRGVADVRLHQSRVSTSRR